MTGKELFEVYENGDPYSKGYNVVEYSKSFDDPTCYFRGDLSGDTREATIAKLRRLYPNSEIRVSRPSQVFRRRNASIGHKLRGNP